MFLSFPFRRLFSSAAFLLLLSRPALAATSPKDMQGTWEGTMGSGSHRFRVAFVLHESGGEYNNVDDGIYGESITLVLRNGSYRYKTSGGGELMVGPGPGGQTLIGTFTQGPGPDARQSLVGEAGYPVTLLPGDAFLHPRVGADGKEQTGYQYEVPLEGPDGWKTGDLRSFHSDVPGIEEAVRHILNNQYPHLHCLLVVKDGRLLLDEYFYGYGPEDPHPVQSMTKSIFSLLFGIGVEQGLCQPAQRLYDFFPSYRSLPGWDTRKDRITLESLLTMTSGLGCDDFKDSKDCSWGMVESPDWLDFSLSLPWGEEPGSHFLYCGACLTPLSGVLEEKSGSSLPDFAQKFLFDPLGIAPPSWWEGPQAIHVPAFGLALRPRDLAKIGLLVLQKGKWGGRQVVPGKWIEESTAPHVRPSKTAPETDYGYLWWEREVPWRGKRLRVLDAWGVGGQHLFIVPELDLVCVLTGGNYKDATLSANSFKIFKELLAAIH